MRDLQKTDIVRIFSDDRGLIRACLTSTLGSFSRGMNGRSSRSGWPHRVAWIELCVTGLMLCAWEVFKVGISLLFILASSDWTLPSLHSQPTNTTYPKPSRDSPVACYCLLVLNWNSLLIPKYINFCELVSVSLFTWVNSCKTHYDISIAMQPSKGTRMKEKGLGPFAHVFHFY